MTQITKQELINLLSNVDKSTFVHLVTETKVRMRKTNNPYYDKVIKRTSCNYLMGNDYEKRVFTNGEKEGIKREENPFEVQEMRGKKHISKVVLVSTNPEKEETHYLMVERFNEISPKVEYIMEGNPIEKELFESFMGSQSENKSQPQEKKVMVITPMIDSIKQISFDKQQYEVI